MSTRLPTLKTEPFDMDSLFDFNQGTTQPSSAVASSSHHDGAPSPYDQEERQKFSGPSHDYNQYKQQVGLPVGSMANLPPQSMFDGYNSGIGDMEFAAVNGWPSGADIDSDMSMDFGNSQSSTPAMFFPPQTRDGQADAFINPHSIGGQEEPTSNVVRVWPGMHSQQAQQAAMQKAALNQAHQQRQMRLQTQHAQYRAVGQQNAATSQPSHGHAKRPSHIAEPHVEESISRLLNQMRQNSMASLADDDSANGGLPHIARMKKDEEEMDEDERLLASEEGKKLSSKERRQLRNKVSARAFRSRRKEYISQLEGEVAVKVQDSVNLRNENAALLQENERYRALIETLLRHPSFTPFLNDISKDPSVLGAPRAAPPPQQHSQQQQQIPTPQQNSQPQQQQPQHSQQSLQQDSKPDFLNFDASQIQVPQQQQSERVGMAMVPDNDFSKLNINGFNNGMDFNSFRSVNAFAVTSLPAGPDPVDLLALPSACSPLSSSAAAATVPYDMTVLLAKLDGAARNVTYAVDAN